MELLNIILERLILLSILAIPLLLAIVVFRCLFSRISKRYVLCLWAVLALRLVCPVVMTNPLSILPAFTIPEQRAQTENTDKTKPDTTPSDSVLSRQETIPSDGILPEQEETLPDSILPEQEKTRPDSILSEREETQTNDISPEQENTGETLLRRKQPLSDTPFTTIFPMAWICVCGLLGAYGLLRGILLRRKLRDAIPLFKGVYSSDRIREPFSLGVIKPRIYLPSGMAKKHRDAVLSHEKEHVRHQDTRINVFAYLLVCVYWFSPPLLIAYFLFITDLEMACDERAVNRLNGKSKQEYANALLACGSGHLLPRFYPVAFGESGVSKRIHNITKEKALSKGAAKGILVLVLLLALCLGNGCEKLVLDKADTNNQSVSSYTTSFQEQNKRTVSFTEDVTGDKMADTITIDISAVTDDEGTILPAEQYKGDGKESTVRVTSGKTGEELYSVNLNPTNHQGGLYLYKRTLSSRTSVETEKLLFLLFEPPASTGEEPYHYEIFSLTEQGERKIEEEHDFTKEEKLQHRDKTYLEQVNEYLFHSIALIDTIGGVTRYSKEQEQLSLVYNTETDCSEPAILGASRDSIKESDFIRVKSNEGWNPTQSSYPGIPFYVAYQEEWQCENLRFRVYFHYQENETKFFGYRDEEMIEAKKGAEQYKEQFVAVNSWDLQPSWAPYIIWSPSSYTSYKEHPGDYYVTAYVVDEQESRLLARQNLTIKCLSKDNIWNYYYSPSKEPGKILLRNN